MTLWTIPTNLKRVTARDTCSVLTLSITLTSVHLDSIPPTISALTAPEWAWSSSMESVKVWFYLGNRMWESSISRNLSFEITADIPEQKVKITPYSDFGVYSFDIDVIPKPGPGPGPEPDKGMEAWRIILIVLGSVIASGFVAYIIFLCYKRSKRDPEENPLERGLNDEEDGSTDRVGALNESVAYTESARHTLNLPTPDSVPAVSEQEN